MLNPRRVLTRAQLLDHVWDYDFGGDARVLETYISYLRKKLDLHGPSLIHTVRGVGYTLRTPRRMIASLRGRLVAGVLVAGRGGHAARRRDHVRRRSVASCSTASTRSSTSATVALEHQLDGDHEQPSTAARARRRPAAGRRRAVGHLRRAARRVRRA